MLEDSVTITGRMRCGRITGAGVIWSEWVDNLVTTFGKNYFLDAADGAVTRFLSAAQGGLLIGNGTTAAAVGDTNLSGATKYRQSMDAGFPTTSGLTRIYQFTVLQATTAANFQHTEFGLTNASTTALSDGGLITHLVKIGGFQKDTDSGLVYQYALTQQ